MSVSLNGSSGNDTLTASGVNTTIDGKDGNDTLTGGKGDDVIIGGNGADIINAGDGDNSIYGFKKWEDYPSNLEIWDQNKDTITAGSGNDRILSVGNNIIDAVDGYNYIFEYHNYLTLGFSGNLHNELGWYPDPIDTSTQSAPWLDLYFSNLVLQFIQKEILIDMQKLKLDLEPIKLLLRKLKLLI